MKKFQLLFAAGIALFAMSFTFATHAKSSKPYSVSAGIWKNISVNGSPYVLFPAANGSATETYAVTGVTATSNVIVPSTDCPAPYQQFCAYNVVANGSSFKVTEVYYKSL